MVCTDLQEQALKKTKKTPKKPLFSRKVTLKIKANSKPECLTLTFQIGIDMYTLMCIKLMTNRNLQYKKTNKQKTTNTKLSLGYLYGNMLI